VTIGEPVLLASGVALTDRFFALFSVSNNGTLLLQRGSGFRSLRADLGGPRREARGHGCRAGPLFLSCALTRRAPPGRRPFQHRGWPGGHLGVRSRPQSLRTTHFRQDERICAELVPDDRRIFFFSNKGNRGDIYELPAGGTGEARVLVDDDKEKRPTSVSRDGQWIAFNSSGGPKGMNSDIWTWSAAEKKASPWLATSFAELCGSFSPDAKWIAYQSNESGRFEIYVRAFPEGEDKWMISNHGGKMPLWSWDGKEIFYISTDGKMMTVAVTTRPAFDASSPVALFDASVAEHPTRQYTVSSDGSRFLLNQLTRNTLFEPMTLIQNWDRKIPAK
jgi:dipeptidyl aminopeptidase/acylaminoacyl peptidase